MEGMIGARRPRMRPARMAPLFLRWLFQGSALAMVLGVVALAIGVVVLTFILLALAVWPVMLLGGFVLLAAWFTWRFFTHSDFEWSRLAERVAGARAPYVVLGVALLLGRYFIWTAASTAVAWLAVHWFFGPAAHLERLALGAIVVALIYAPFNLRRLA